MVGFVGHRSGNAGDRDGSSEACLKGTSQPPGMADWLNADSLVWQAKTHLHHATETDSVMAHWKKGFPSKYLQVSDLDTPIVATIAGVRSETVGSGDDAESKLVVRFKEPDVKAVVLNLTRAEAIATIVGNDDTDKWVGHRIQLFQGSTRFQGKKVPCIAISEPTTGDDIDETMQPLKAEAF
jgi:hypothetical protein